MFKLDEMRLVDAFIAEVSALEPCRDTVQMGTCAVRAELARQIKEAGGPDGSLEEQLRALLASHKALAEAGEEMPSVEALCIMATGDDGSKQTPEERRAMRAEMARARELFRPAFARVLREWKKEADALALLHAKEERATRGAKTSYAVNVDTSEAQAKLETLLASAREYEATLDRALAKTQALASCSSPANIGIGDPPPKPPPPPPAVAFARVCSECGAVEGDGRQGCIETFPPQHDWKRKP